MSDKHTKTVLSWKLHISDSGKNFPSELQDAFCNPMLQGFSTQPFVLKVTDPWSVGYVQALVDAEVPGADKLQKILFTHKAIELYFRGVPES